jgi:hypothetical protein
MAKVMKKPFVVLMHLFIASNDGNAPVLPAEFLGGFAPRLQSMSLLDIPFPALPTLLLSTSDLVSLNLRNFTRGDGCGFGRNAQAQKFCF